MKEEKTICICGHDIDDHAMLTEECWGNDEKCTCGKFREKIDRDEYDEQLD